MDIFYKNFLAVSLILYFIGFIVKNISTAIRTGQAIRGNSIKVIIISIITPLLYLLIITNIMKGADLLFRINRLDYGIIKIIGLILVSISLILGFISLITMRDSWRVGIRPEQRTDLITNGVFRFSRNPYFLSYILIFLGCFLIILTYVFLIIYLIWIILIHLLILDEEKYLTEQHGDIYKDYKSRVNRYLTIKQCTNAQQLI
jgi:protein-S-isoprenylcysteine O-methyltransferase Ste14